MLNPEVKYRVKGRILFSKSAHRKDDLISIYVNIIGNKGRLKDCMELKVC
jgi:hypothetical protein